MVGEHSRAVLPARAWETLQGGVIGMLLLQYFRSLNIGPVETTVVAARFGGDLHATGDKIGNM